MRARARMPLSMVAAAALILAAVAPADAAKQRTIPRPDLVVSGGSVKVAAGGKVSGRFVVANSGRARAGRSTAALSVRAKGRWRAVKRFDLPRISAHRSTTVTITATLPRSLPAGALALRVCADSGQAVRERSNANNCRTLGTTAISTPAPAPLPAPAPIPGPVVQPLPTMPPPITPAPTPPSRPASSVPTAPIAFTKDNVFYITDSEGGYWITVPDSYDATHQTPITLFVWMHGCQGQDAGDIYTISPGGNDQHYIAISPDGRENDCWYPNVDMPKVLAAVENVKTHFNINPRKVVVGGYSSGGDLAYRTAFYNAYTFAGVLAENTSPFRDTGSSQADSLAAAYWKFNVVHLAHTGDTEYPIAGVRSETDALTAAGFPMTRIERPGDHYDGNTDSDLQTLLLPHLDDGWLAPP